MNEDKDEPLFPAIQSTEQLKKEIWNAAIEAAATQAAHTIGTETLLATHVTMEIRKLKK